MRKYNLEEIKNNIIKLRNKLKKSNKDKGFWVIADREDFKPLIREVDKNGETTKKIVTKSSEIKKYLLKNNSKYFIGKKFALVEFWFNDILYENKKRYNDENYEDIKNKPIVSITIVVGQVNEKGKFFKDASAHLNWMCKVYYTIQDLSNLKIKYKDSEKIMRDVANKVIISNSPFGINYKNYINILKK